MYDGTTNGGNGSSYGTTNRAQDLTRPNGRELYALDFLSPEAAECLMRGRGYEGQRVDPTLMTIIPSRMDRTVQRAAMPTQPRPV